MSELRKSLGTLQLLAYGVAGVVGASWIYTNSTFFAAYGAGGVILGLCLGVALAACVALAYARLAQAFPRAGGEVVFSFAALGRGPSFFTGWMLLGAYVSSLAFYVTAFGYLLGRFIPALDTIPLYTINGETVYLPGLAIGVALTFAFFALNWFGISVGAQVQILMFALIILGGLALIVTGFTVGSPENFFPAFAPDASPLLDTLRFVVPGMTFLAGFGLVAVLAEDAKISPRRIGLTVVWTVIVAGSFYVLVLLATAWVQPWEEVAAMKLGTVDAFRAAGFPALSTVAYGIAVLGLLTSFLGLFVASSRILVAMGRADLLPRRLASVDERTGTPRTALVFTLVITLGLGWLGPGAVTWFLDTGGIYLGVVWIMVVIANLRLPASRVPRSLPATVLSVVGAVGALAVIVLALWPGTGSSLVWPSEYLILLVWLVLGVVLYAVSRRTDPQASLRALLGHDSPDAEIPARRAAAAESNSGETR